MYRLNKQDLIRMIRGSIPHTDVQKELSENNMGNYMKSLHSWQWNEPQLAKYNEKDLFIFYKSLEGFIVN